ncbi:MULTISPECIES: thiamine phosphate synthase [unclassified Pseudovibrio]|uniref:thiamine phosphate synthase n=1 Tax=unclassified Pseudovibrio TaxID=2627060 RepID=UPI0007AEA7E1|nr:MULTISPECIES: thiamine phosphate synthase [unclassified Pseudovibrio]KZL04038.1 Thiamine-phosphate synthase [Pseudovibrio sp. W74]KZL04257.1 Thiamine-phosphate synthase [Pseudovibrio sp. Ad14]
MHPRLYLVTPPTFDLNEFEGQLNQALEGGDIASLLISMPDANESDLQAAAKRLVPLAQAKEVAVLIENNTQIMGRSGADGLHVSGSDKDLEEAMQSFSEDRIIGHAGIKTRHEAMTVASMGVDYMFFGLLSLNQEEEPHRKSLDYGHWWSEVFETPCVILAGTSVSSVDTAAQTGAEFVAVREAVWNHPEGPKAAVEQANAILSTHTLAEAED